MLSAGAMNSNVNNIDRRRVVRRLESIKDFLTAAGAEVLVPTNEYELIRFKADGVTSVVYRRERGDTVSMTGDALKALQAFFGGPAWNAVGKTKRRRDWASPEIRTLIERDGPDCFACGWPVTKETASRDHLVPLASGGPDHIANKVLMHRDCNYQVGHMSAPEKIRMHVESRMARV